MSNRGLINPSLLINIADKIRTKLDVDSRYTPTDMVGAVEAVYQKGFVEGEKSSGGQTFGASLPKYCCYVATGVLVADSSNYCDLTLKGEYAFTDDGVHTKYCFYTAFTTSDVYADVLRNKGTVGIASDYQVSSGSTYRGRFIYNAPSSSTPMWSNGSAQLNSMPVYTELNGTCEITLYYCDKAKYEADPENYPQKVDITKMCDNSTGTLINRSQHSPVVTNKLKLKVYDGVVVSTVKGTGAYVVLAKDELLAEHRSDKYLFIRVEFIIEPTAHTVFSAWTQNTQQFIPINNNQPRQVFRRWGSDSELTYNNSVYPVHDDTDVGIGVGRVYITEDGELRCYSNSSNFAIRPCEYRIIVEWEDNYVI